MDMDNKRLVIKSDEALFNKAKEFEKKYNLFGFSGMVQNDMEISIEDFTEFTITTSKLINSRINELANEATALIKEIHDHIASTN